MYRVEVYCVEMYCVEMYCVEMYCRDVLCRDVLCRDVLCRDVLCRDVLWPGVCGITQHVTYFVVCTYWKKTLVQLLTWYYFKIQTHHATVLQSSSLQDIPNREL